MQKMKKFFQRKKSRSEDGEPPPFVTAKFQEVAKGHKYIGEVEFRQFLADQGLVNVTDEYFAALLDEAFGEHHGHKRKIELTVQDFFHFLLHSSACAPLDNKVFHDMTQPLSHYFIWTGHNSYLEGNQLTSNSSIAPIIEALKAGCRVVELDIWPGGKDDGEISVLHGGTMTKAVSFEACVQAIVDHAFIASEWPVVITLEDHLTRSLQSKAAEILIRVIGATLYTPPEGGIKDHFPSPADLKHRIIISTKPPAEAAEDVQEAVTAEGSSPSGGSPKAQTPPGQAGVTSEAVDALGADLKTDLHVGTKPPPAAPVTHNPTIPQIVGETLTRTVREEEEGVGPVSSTQAGGVPLASQGAGVGTLTGAVTGTPSAITGTTSGVTTGNQADDASLDDEDDDLGDLPSRPAGAGLSHLQSLVPVGYRKLILMHAGKPKGGTTLDALQPGGRPRRVSLSEKQLVKAAEKYGTAIVKFTQNNMLRVYPFGLRFDSSNYNPMLAWIYGAQMVALNMQGYGRPLWCVYGFFAANGGAGYVKKPDFMLQDPTFDPQAPRPPKLLLKVRVLQLVGMLERYGKKHFDSFSPPDFYTKVAILGVPADESSQKTTVTDNEWRPSWPDMVFSFNLGVPELAVLRLEVMEHDTAEKNDFGGQCCLPVAELRSGIRTVHLKDKKCVELGGPALICHFELVPVAEGPLIAQS